MNNIEQLEQQLAETKKQIEQLEKQLNEAKTPKKWEPQGGDFFIHANGQIRDAFSKTIYCQFGVERPTFDLAKKAQKAMRTHNRLLAYVHEFAPDYTPAFDGTTRNCCVFYYNGKWEVDVWSDFNYAGMVYMPEHVAEELVKKLNSGEVEL